MRISIYLMNQDYLYAVGDVHGCLPNLKELFEKLDRDIPVVFVGDIVNRGPFSLETLRFVKSLGARARVLLGNHDLHLLCAAAGAAKMSPKDTIQEVLDAPDAGELIDYLRGQSLLIRFREFTLVHAAIDLAWDLNKAQTLAREVETKLRSPDWKYWLSDMYGKDLWDESLTGLARLRAVLNGFTRIRYVKADGTPDYRAKLAPEVTDPSLIPWFMSPKRKTRDTVVVAGHWSTLGLKMTDDFIGIDTGCLWGGALTAVRLPDRKVISVKSSGYQDPTKFS